MDLDRINDVEKLALCKRYFIGGFFALPLLWLMNACWFFKQAFFRNPFPEQAMIRAYVSGSLFGCIFYTIPIILWVIYFQKYRVEWGAWADAITYIKPAGMP